MNKPDRRGSKLNKLYLNDTKASDLSPLKGMPIDELTAGAWCNS